MIRINIKTVTIILRRRPIIRNYFIEKMEETVHPYLITKMRRESRKQNAMNSHHIAKP